MVAPYFKFVNFEELKEELGLEKAFLSEWFEQENGVLVRPLITESESIDKNVSYLGLKFPGPTDGHRYKTQTDTILFANNGEIEFSRKKNANREILEFYEGEAIRIEPPIIRKLIPVKKRLEIELIVQPRFNLADETKVYV